MEESLMENSENKKNKFLNSPIAITVIGFLLTGLVGSILTHRWQMKEYTYKAKLEQEYSRIKAHHQSWENIYNKIFDQTSIFIIAIARVISIYEHSIRNPRQRNDIIKNFNCVSIKWFKESIVIRSQLRLLFFKRESPEIIAKIEKDWSALIDESKNLHRNVAKLITYYKVDDKSPKLTHIFNECHKLADKYTERVYSFGSNLISTIFHE
jgi:hypothetical protein